MRQIKDKTVHYESNHFPCYLNFRTELDTKFTNFFLKYTQEDNESIFFEHYDSNNPHTHLLKNFFSDVLTLQSENHLMHSEKHSDVSSCRLYCLPVMLIVSDKNTQKGAFWKLNCPEVIAKGDNLSRDKLYQEFIKEFKNKTKDEIEKLIVNFEGGIFQELCIGNRIKRNKMSDLAVGADIINNIITKWKNKWGELTCQSDIYSLSEFDSIQATTNHNILNGFYKHFPIFRVSYGSLKSINTSFRPI